MQNWPLFLLIGGWWIFGRLCVLYFIFREVNVECKPIISFFAKPALSFGLICKCVSYESAIKGHFHLLNDLTDVHRFPCANIKYTAEVGFICTACVTLFPVGWTDAGPLGHWEMTLIDGRCPRSQYPTD